MLLSLILKQNEVFKFSTNCCTFFHFRTQVTLNSKRWVGKMKQMCRSARQDVCVTYFRGIVHMLFQCSRLDPISVLSFFLLKGLRSSSPFCALKVKGFMFRNHLFTSMKCSINLEMEFLTFGPQTLDLGLSAAFHWGSGWYLNVNHFFFSLENRNWYPPQRRKLCASLSPSCSITNIAVGVGGRHFARQTASIHPWMLSVLFPHCFFILLWTQQKALNPVWREIWVQEFQEFL